MRNRVNINGVQVPARHAAFARFAIDGYSYAKKNMAPFVFKPYETPPATERKTLRLNKRKQAPNNPAQPITKAASRHKGKSTAFRKKKKVKLPKGFKSKVEKALEPKQINGTWRQISFDIMKQNIFTTNQQAVGGLGTFVANDFSNWCFDSEDFLHMASVLWNAKADSQTTRPWTNVNNLGHNILTGTVGIGEGRIPGRSRAPMTLKLLIKNSSETYKLKNNTQRTIVMKIFLLAPKQIGTKNFAQTEQPNSEEADAGTSSNNYIGDPPSLWAAALSSQNVQNVNVLAATVNTLYNNPLSCPVFNQTYKSDVTTVVLEPGQVYDYFIQGPQNLNLDFNKHFTSGNGKGIYMGIRKHMRFPMVTAYLDTITDGNFVGHYPSTGAAQLKLGVCIERIMKAHIAMPDTVGTYLNVGGALPGAGFVELNMRRDCYALPVYSDVGPIADARRVDVQDPTAPEDMDI